MKKTEREIALEARIEELEAELQQMRARSFISSGPTVKVFDAVASLFSEAEKTVGSYFSKMKVDPTRASIDIEGQRYLLLRASSLSVDFFEVIQKLYADQGESAAFGIGQNFLFDIAHVIGLEDAVNFHRKMKLTDPLAKLSAGPVHFAFSGWAFVELLPDCVPSPDEHFYMHYRHPYSFEANSWIEKGKHSEHPVCIMNAGYSSGWCEASFGIPLTAVEVTCRACGDEHCTFVMAPPHKIQEHLKIYQQSNKIRDYEQRIPTFFNRKEVEAQIKKAKEKAEASDRAKSEFLANMSHEIRTPLNTIIGYTDLLSQEPMSKEQKEFLKNVQSSSYHLLNIVNDVLDLSKIEAGQLMQHTEACRLHEELERKQHQMRALLRKDREEVDLILQIDPEVAEVVLTDITKLNQILYNLLYNAVKFTEKGKIEWGVKLLDSQRLFFYVRDSGIGIPFEKQALIFDMFQQADNSVSRKYGGVGLGLTITKRLVELLGGEISVESKPNEGAYFHFWLPYHPYQEEISNAVPSITLPKQTVNTQKVLLVEDNLLNLKLAEKILKNAGFEVLCAVNGQELLDVFEAYEQEISAVITDIQMPIMDGIDAVRTLRTMGKRGAAIPVIALTAHAMQGDMERCLAAGCDAYLTKPLNAKQLIEKIHQLLYK